MHPVRALEELGGVGRYRTLRERGVTRHHLAAAIRSGVVERVRNGWFALPGIDAELRSAAQLGAHLSCVTLLRRREVWALPVSTVHVAAAPHATLARTTTAQVHWATPAQPRDPDALEDTLLNALVLVATCQPYERSLAAWESALRKELIDPEVLRGLRLPPDARRMLADAKPFADAGGESIVDWRLRRLRLGVPIRRQVVLLGRPVDLLVGERLVIQIDGGTHVDRQRLADNEHDARLRLRGYTVIRIGHWQILDDWATVQDLILTAIAQGLHLARS
ncbi:endonuclease domain-containing protein [Microbacterium phosphatis]|uniref:endonuclease domain-containing protein n=1 Tax=Microbacterium phosphatis TaxID=3140248 RepID=UPI003140A407